MVLFDIFTCFNNPCCELIKYAASSFERNLKVSYFFCKSLYFLTIASIYVNIIVVCGYGRGKGERKKNENKGGKEKKTKFSFQIV